MADETSPDPTPDPDGAATPNRDRRHEPPVIEGEIARGETAPPEDRAESAEHDEHSDVAQETASAPVAEPEHKSASARPILSAAIGAVVGAVVATAAVWFVEQRPAADPEIVARLEGLERAPHPAAPTEALAALDKRLSALEAAVGRAPDKAALDAYGQRIAALESAALSAKAAADAGKDALAAAQAARDDAAKALALASTAAQNANGGAAPAVQALGADAAALESRIGKLEQDLATLARPPAELALIGQRLDKLENALAAPKTESRVAAEPAAPGRDGAGLAVAAQALRERLRVGAPFPSEAAALERLGADPAMLAILKPLAEKGAPSAAVLAADFAKVAPAALAAATPAAPGGVMDRLLANMSKIVRVTPVGEIAGDEPAALISQIGAALGRGDVGAAVAAWARLPEAARQASKEWVSEAQAALGADKAAQGVVDDAIARLAAAKN